MKKTTKHLLCALPALLLNLLYPADAGGQTTGSFDTSITFMSAPRQLSLYVPPSYNAATKYRLMICLHGLGDNSANYRNTLINSLSLGVHMPNTIFVCPEAATVNSDYFMPAGGEAIIQQSIAQAMSRYHIDTANVILQGFSLGGRAALRYGLINSSIFKGLLLNTPALQGVKEALSGNAAYPFTYTNASWIPVYITHGGTDIFYTSPIDSAYEQLIRNNGIVRLARFPSLGHTIPQMGQMGDFLSFFDTPAHAGHDLEIVKPMVLDRTCAAQVVPSILVRNTGQAPITSASFRYTHNGTPYTHTWTGNLSSFQHATISLPVINAATGSNALVINADSINGSIPDTVLANNQKTAGFQKGGTGQALPLQEGFEGATFPPPGWLLERAGDVYSPWDLDDANAKTGKNSAYAFNTVLFFDNAGRRENLISPLLDLSTVSSPRVSFDVAFNYHRYTPPYVVADADFADTLEVMISTDCGSSYISLFKKGGKDLATFSAPITNALNVNSAFINPADSNWKHISLDLSPYASSNTAVVKFSYISANGGSINLDNISFSKPSTSIAETAAGTIRVYPNPATDEVFIDAGNGPVSQVLLTDISGKVLRFARTPQSARATLEIHDLPAGLYLVRVETPGGSSIHKLTVRR